MNAVMKNTNKSKGSYFKVANRIWGIKDIFVNVYMVQNLSNDKWFLIDTGLKTSYGKIKKMASKLFGKSSKPEAIVLTHGHFDHVGSLQKLIEDWRVPVYAHYLELPYLTGKSSYPPADPTVGGGLMAYMAGLYPNKPIDLENEITALPEDGTIPGMKGWRYLHTPGHAPGHISLFRKEDEVLIAGDAFVTTKQESAWAVMFQTKKISGPPAYFTYDWAAASDSVRRLKMLSPEVVATGHGKPMSGNEMRRELANMQEHFYNNVVPHRGRYVVEPAVTDANGVLYVPSRKYNPYVKWFAVAGVIAATATLIIIVVTKQTRKRKVLWMK